MQTEAQVEATRGSSGVKQSEGPSTAKTGIDAMKVALPSAYGRTQAMNVQALNPLALLDSMTRVASLFVSGIIPQKQ